MADTHADVIVVGGGMGGLVLARRLAIGGASVILLEAGDRLGGTVSSHRVGGLDLDAGAESFAVRGGTVVALATELGLAADIVEPNPAGAWLQPATGDAKPMPGLSLMGIPGSPRAADVVAIVGRRAALRASAERFLPGSWAADSTTVGELVRRRMGSAVLENLVAPIVRGVYSADPDELDVNRVSPGLIDEMRRTGSLAGAVLAKRPPSKAGSAVAGIRGGIHRIIEELAADAVRRGVDIRLDSRVTDVADGQVIVGGQRITGRVVVATAGLLGDTANPGHLAVLATLVVDQPLLDAAPRGTGVLVAAGASGIDARALTHATAKWPWLAEQAAGKHVVRLSYATAPDSPADVARRDAVRLLGVELSPESVLDFALVQWRRPPRQAHTPDGISLVGETASGTGMAAVVAHADAQALLMLRDFAR